MSKKKNFILTITFPARTMKEWEYGNNVLHKVLGFSGAAGTDVISGEREMIWYDLSEREGEKMLARAKSLRVPGLEGYVEKEE